MAKLADYVGGPAITRFAIFYLLRTTSVLTMTPAYIGQYLAPEPTILLQLLCHKRQLAGETVFADAYRHSRTRSYRYLVPSKMTKRAVSYCCLEMSTPLIVNIEKLFSCARKF